MNPDLDAGLRVLEEASELAARLRIDVTDDYVRLIEAVEALPENQTGADKSGRWRGGPERQRSIRGPLPAPTP